VFPLEKRRWRPIHLALFGKDCWPKPTFDPSQGSRIWEFGDSRHDRGLVFLPLRHQQTSSADAKHTCVQLFRSEQVFGHSGTARRTRVPWQTEHVWQIACLGTQVLAVRQWACSRVTDRTCWTASSILGHGLDYSSVASKSSKKELITPRVQHLVLVVDVMVWSINLQTVRPPSNNFWIAWWFGPAEWGRDTWMPCWPVETRDSGQGVFVALVHLHLPPGRPAPSQMPPPWASFLFLEGLVAPFVALLSPPRRRDAARAARANVERGSTSLWYAIPRVPPLSPCSLFSPHVE
jgi:hypothetical protein